MGDARGRDVPCHSPQGVQATLGGGRVSTCPSGFPRPIELLLEILLTVTEPGEQLPVERRIALHAFQPNLHVHAG